MIRIFSHENRMILFNIRNLLESEGIDTVVVNEFAAGGVGDLAAFDTWPELWLKDESRLRDAQAVLEGILDDDSAGEWFCRGCQESNPAAFQSCWNCGRTSK